MNYWVLIGGLAAGVLFYIYEYNKNREQQHRQYEYRDSRSHQYEDGDFNESEGWVSIDRREVLEARLGPNRKMPGRDELCSICLDPLFRRGSVRKYAIIALPNCGHWLHSACAHRLLSYSPMCPVCRVPIDPEKIRSQPVRLVENDSDDDAQTSISDRELSSIQSRSRHSDREFAR